MKNPIPDFVDQVLRQWDFIAFFAYDNFELSGRGAVGLENSKDGKLCGFKLASVRSRAFGGRPVRSTLGGDSQSVSI